MFAIIELLLFCVVMYYMYILIKHNLTLVLNKSSSFFRFLANSLNSFSDALDKEALEKKSKNT